MTLPTNLVTGRTARLPGDFSKQGEAQPAKAGRWSRFARGRKRHMPGTMNKTERAYSEHLEAEKSAGRILWYVFEGIKLRLADKTFLTVDFAVMRPDGLIELHEVKGFMEDDAAVKLKVAASLYPFKIIVVKQQAKKNGGGWTLTEL